MIALPRSSYYYQARERAVALTDAELEELIGTVQDELPGYGYRDVTEMMQERSVMVDHSTIFRWVQRYAPEIEKRVHWYRATARRPGG